LNRLIIKNTIGWCILTIGVFIIVWVFQFSKIKELPFGSYHAWRQADCISVTQQLHEKNATIFYPKTHYLKNDGTGIAAGEFPLVNALVAFVNQFTKNNLVAYRIIIAIFYVIAIVFMYLLFLKVSGDGITSSITALLISSGSVLAYYSINFLPDVPAFALTVVGMYCVIETKLLTNPISFTIGILFFTLAGLIKISTTIIPATFFVIIILEKLMAGKDHYFKYKVSSIIISGIIVALWYRHAYVLDHSHAPFVFLTETRSYWQTYFAEKPIIWKEIRETWLPQVFLPIVWVWIIVGALISIVKAVKTKLAWVGGVVVSIVLCGVFILLMFRQFMLHDYLWIGLLPVVVLMNIFIVYVIGQLKNKIARLTARISIIFLLILQVFNTQLILQNRYFGLDANLAYNQHLLSITPLLRENGIKKEDKVISIPDASPNISLVAMDQQGWTNYRETGVSEEFIEEKINSGAQYLIFSNTSDLKAESLEKYLKYFMFRHYEIFVFDLRPYAK